MSAARQCASMTRPITRLISHKSSQHGPRKHPGSTAVPLRARLQPNKLTAPQPRIDYTAINPTVERTWGRTKTPSVLGTYPEWSMRLPSSACKTQSALLLLSTCLTGGSGANGSFISAQCKVGLCQRVGSCWELLRGFALCSRLLRFQALGISDTIPRYTSTSDLARIAKAVVGGQLMTTIALFTMIKLV